MRQVIAKLEFWKSVVVPLAHSTADTLSLREKRSSAKLELNNNIRLTSLSTGVFQGSACGICNLPNSSYEKESFAIAYE